MVPGRPHVHVVRGTGEEVRRVVLQPGSRKRWMREDGSYVPDEQVEVKQR